MHTFMLLNTVISLPLGTAYTMSRIPTGRAQMCLYNLFLTNKSRDEQSKWLTIIKCCQTTCVLAAIDSAFKAFACSLIIISGLRELTPCGGSGRGDDHITYSADSPRTHMWPNENDMKGARGVIKFRSRSRVVCTEPQYGNITRAQTSINMRFTPSILI